MAQIENNINELPFKLRFTSTEKLCKEVSKLVHERFDAYDKLTIELEHIKEHQMILGIIFFLFCPYFFLLKCFLCIEFCAKVFFRS